MYNELYAAWHKEIEEPSLGYLPPDFYVRIAEYLRHVKEENKVLEKKSLKTNLLDLEARNVNRMLEELLEARYKKIVKTITESQKLPTDMLTFEEVKMGESFVVFSSAYQKFAKSLLQGQTQRVEAIPQESMEPIKVEAPIAHKRVTLRFSKAIPTIMGVDMKTYGPFKPEDVASLPAENARILVKQGLAVVVEVS